MDEMAFAVELARHVLSDKGMSDLFECAGANVTQIGDVAVSSRGGEIVAQIYQRDDAMFAVVELYLDAADDDRPTKCNVAIASSMRQALAQFEEILDHAQVAQQNELVEDAFAVARQQGNQPPASRR